MVGFTILAHVGFKHLRICMYMVYNYDVYKKSVSWKASIFVNFHRIHVSIQCTIIIVDFNPPWVAGWLSCDYTANLT